MALTSNYFAKKMQMWLSFEQASKHLMGQCANIGYVVHYTALD